MELRTRKAWAAALLAVTVMALAPGRAVAQGMDPGELKARMESFSVSTPVTDPGEVKAMTESFAYEVPKVRVLEPGELKRIAEAPARFAVLDPTSQGDSTTVVDSEGVDWSGIGVASLILLLAVGAAVSFNRWRHNHIAPA